MDIEPCIDACRACADACESTAAACMEGESVKVMARRVELDNLLATSRSLSSISSAALDCAQICRVAGSCLARGSEVARRVCTACADLCERCAAVCEQYPMDHCRQCAAACRRCAHECSVIARRRVAAPAREAVPA